MVTHRHISFLNMATLTQHIMIITPASRGFSGATVLNPCYSRANGILSSSLAVLLIKDVIIARSFGP